MHSASTLGLIIKEVKDLTHEGHKARAVTASVSYATDPSDLWDAITNPERIPRWFSPISGDFHEGGKYQIEGNAGGTIITCDQPKALHLTWEMQGNVSWVMVTLEKDGDKTKLTLQHIAPITPDAEAFWDQYGPGAVGVGWDLSLLALDQYVRTGVQVNTPENLEKLQSAEGVEMIKVSSRGWRDASIAYGTAVEKADAAEAATTAFYTGAG